VKVYIAQLNPTVGDIEANTARIRESVRRGRSAGAEVAVFPELAIQGYPPRDLLENPSFIEAGMKALSDVAREATGIEVVVGFAERNPSPQGRALFNAAALLRDGRVASISRKSLLPTYDVFDEHRHFEAAPSRKVEQVAGRPTGVTVCEDAWTDREIFQRDLYRCDPIAELVDQGAGVVLNISASPFSLGRSVLRERLLREHALRHGVPLVCVNQVGGNDELLFDGSSVVIDAQGKTRVRLAAFAEDERLVDLDRLPPAIGDEPASAEAEAYGALVMGTRDYVRKCGFSEVVIGLSGGIDSSVTAAVAADALGADHVTGIAMPARYSSPESLADARALAENLGISFRVIPADGLFQSYIDTLAGELGGKPSGVTGENIQARIRGNILMALSNTFGWLVLTTGNKSELAVGYCTLYGDMSGGLAVISDVPKTLVYRIARFINSRGKTIPDRVLAKAPSAELRPDQKDEDSLPPYELLDAILRLYVEERRSAEQIVREGYDRALVHEILELVDRNEYKRKQAAPGLRITTKAFGLGRRMPIAQRWRQEPLP
jgi:NAD+ synthetase